MVNTFLYSYTSLKEMQAQIEMTIPSPDAVFTYTTWAVKKALQDYAKEQRQDKDVVKVTKRGDENR